MTYWLRAALVIAVAVMAAVATGCGSSAPATSPEVAKIERLVRERREDAAAWQAELKAMKAAPTTTYKFLVAQRRGKAALKAEEAIDAQIQGGHYKTSAIHEAIESVYGMSWRAYLAKLKENPDY